MFKKNYIVAVAVFVFMLFGIFSYALNNNEEPEENIIVNNNETKNTESDKSEDNKKGESVYQVSTGVKDGFVDDEKPVIILNGDNTVYLEIGIDKTYVDAGAVVYDNFDESIVPSVVNNVVIDQLGTYTVTYTAVDSYGNEAVPVVRTIIVRDTTKPKITGFSVKWNYETVEADKTATYIDTAEVYTSDNSDGEVTVERLRCTVDMGTPGDYKCQYKVSDESGNYQHYDRFIKVVDTTKPKITGFSVKWNYETVEADKTATYIDTAEVYTSDNSDGEVTVERLRCTVDMGTPGDYKCQYKVSDESGNYQHYDRFIKVVDTTKPKITGFSVKWNYETVEADKTATYIDTAEVYTSDNSDGEVTVERLRCTVDMGTPGDYKCQYKVSDESGNYQHYDRFIKVVDTKFPVVLFETNGNSIYAKNHSTIVNIDDVSSLKANRIRYMWTTGARPDWNTWFSEGKQFNSGDTITNPVGVNGVYYLWIMTEDVIGNRGYTKSNAFYFDNNYPSVSFLINGNSTYSQSHSTQVNITDVSDLKANRIRYMWTTGARPDWDTWFSEGKQFSNGDIIDSTDNLNGVYYLWIMTEDVIGNRGYTKSNAFYFDNENPTIQLNGESYIEVELGSNFDIMEGIIANDNSNIFNVTHNNVDFSTIGLKTITYTVTDSVGRTASLERTIKVVDTTSPAIELGNINYSANYKNIFGFNLFQNATATFHVNVSDLGNINKLKYLWLPHNEEPNSIAWLLAPKFTNNSDISKTFYIKGLKWKLWIYATDESGNVSITSSEKFEIE